MMGGHVVSLAPAGTKKETEGIKGLITCGHWAVSMDGWRWRKKDEVDEIKEREREMMIGFVI